MVYNVALVSAVQKSESVIHTHISTLLFLFFINFLKFYLFLFLTEWVFVGVHRLLIAVASLVKHRLWGTRASVVVAQGLSSCGVWA